MNEPVKGEREREGRNRSVSGTVTARRHDNDSWVFAAQCLVVR